MGGYERTSDADRKQAEADSNFDAHHPPEKELLADCVHCGFCLPACPTYVLWGEEMDSPRGRIYMMDRAADGTGAAGQDIPAAHGQLPGLHGVHDGVSFRRAVRQADRGHARAGGAQRSRGRGRLAVSPDAVCDFPHPRRLRALAGPLRFYQRTGLQKQVRASGLLEEVAEAACGDGGAAAGCAARASRAGAGDHGGAEWQAPARGHADRLCAAGVLLACECRRRRACWRRRDAR